MLFLNLSNCNLSLCGIQNSNRTSQVQSQARSLQQRWQHVYTLLLWFYHTTSSLLWFKCLLGGNVVQVGVGGSTSTHFRVDRYDGKPISPTSVLSVYIQTYAPLDEGTQEEGNTHMWLTYRRQITFYQPSGELSSRQVGGLKKFNWAVWTFSTQTRYDAA